MKDFKKAAQAQVSLSPIMVGRAQLETDEVTGRELTVVGFDFAPKFDKEGNPIIDPETGEVDTFGVVVFNEEPGKYYCVGTIFTKVCRAWVAEYDNPVEASADLEKSGGVRVRFTRAKTKRGNNLVQVEILN